LGDGLSVTGLTIRVGSRDLVRDVALDLPLGQLIAVVGRSGSGKSLTARALLGMVDLRPGVVAADLRIAIDGRAWTPYAGAPRDGRALDRAFAEIRGAVVGYLPQDCRAALDPLARVGPQVAAVARLAGRAPDPRPWLARANLPDPERVAALYPHELSGGMAQRVAIAQVLARGSRILIADEPTSALDPTVQAAVLRELRALADGGCAVLLITHDLRVLPGLADQVVIFDEGRAVERASPDALRTGALASAPGRRLHAATARIAAGVLG
jgi:ABC-type dipeptide/oligopeptide/nickel transport system ATPase component